MFSISAVQYLVIGLPAALLELSSLSRRLRRPVCCLASAACDVLLVGDAGLVSEPLLPDG